MQVLDTGWYPFDGHCSCHLTLCTIETNYGLPGYYRYWAACLRTVCRCPTPIPTLPLTLTRNWVACGRLADAGILDEHAVCGTGGPRLH